jgi:hypothetical protein
MEVDNKVEIDNDGASMLGYFSSIHEFDQFWSLLPHGEDYSRFEDSRYWEYRIAVLIGGAVIGVKNYTKKNQFDRKGDVQLGNIVIEVKKAVLKRHSHDTKGFNFSHIRGQRGRAIYCSKFVDIIILIGICDCETGIHFWIGDYRDITDNMGKNDYIFTLCPNRAKIKKRKFFQEIYEHDIFHWITSWKQNQWCLKNT